METGKHGLKRELKLWDLVPMQIIVILWLGWTGFAAKQGPTQLVLWLLAILLFYLPLAAVVMKLSRSLPIEGGVYQWVKVGFSPFAGYMAGWNFSFCWVFAFATVGSVVANGLAHGTGSGAAWMFTSRPFALGLTVLACFAAFVINVRGLQITKRWADAGALLTVAMFATLIFLLARAAWMKLPSAQGSFSLALPAFSILTVNVFTKMAIYALSGFDGVAILCEECRKPENDVARSVLVAAPLIAVIYILGTNSVLAYILPADVDLAASVPQIIEAGFGATTLGRALSFTGSCAFSLALFFQMIVFVGMIARLPMVAGWDGLLPGWWSELHPTRKTPSKAIAAVAFSMLLLGSLSLWGAENQEAMQVGAGAGFGSLCIMYMLLFGVTLIGFRSGGVRSGMGLRIGALAAFLVSLCGLVFEIVPLGDVANRGLFAIKVGAMICAANVFGAYLYWRGTRRGVTPATKLQYK